MGISEKTYPIARHTNEWFTFISEGPKGYYELIGLFNFKEITDINGKLIPTYNFGYGLYEAQKDGTANLNDKILLGNGDSYKIFWTVSNQIKLFLDRNPRATIFISGSTPERTYIYALLVSKHYKTISQQVTVKAVLKDKTIENYPWDKIDYIDGFLIEKKP